MELLTIQHADFTMSIECGKFDAIWTKAKNNIGEQALHSTYSWTEGVVAVTLNTDDGERQIEKGETAPAVFFDNADYPIWVEFADYVKDAQFGSELQGDNERFAFRRHILAGFLNYGNEIGKSEIHLIYETKEGTKRFTFSFEVLSTKLDYHKHWRSIIEDIEAEYRMLSLDYMRRTFHGFSPDQSGETPEIVWWSVFAIEQKKFIRACKSIIERPRHRLHGQETYRRADQLKVVPREIENTLAEHRKDNGHLYRVEEQIQSNDTQENRFLKFALNQITSKYDVLKRRVENLNNVSEVKKEEMRNTLSTLQHLQRNPFFRTVGRYKGMSQESMVLHKATGYSQVYRTWNLLRRGYSLYDGLYRLQTKDIATLYEIWCFIEVSHIVKEKLQLSDADVDHRNRMEMNGVFTWELGKGEHSRILFKKDNVELAELVYNPKSTERENSDMGMNDLVVRTVPQKPDIVLQLTKNDLQQGMKMTYLFDAKYRIADRQNGVDTPPDDAVNQMHRYRDAIYYKEHGSEALKKEVIGGYILFPGDGEPDDVAMARFHKSIEEVNIGAFPLRPKDRRNRRLLEDFIEQLIGKDTGKILDDSIPQKGLFYTSEEPKDAVYMILTLDEQVNEDVTSILEGKASHIIMGKKGLEEAKDIQSIRYIAPIKPGSHIEGYYRVSQARLKRIDDAAYPVRIIFDVKDWVKLKTPAKYGLVKYAYRGHCKTRAEFFKHCENNPAIDKL